MQRELRIFDQGRLVESIKINTLYWRSRDKLILDQFLFVKSRSGYIRAYSYSIESRKKGEFFGMFQYLELYHGDMKILSFYPQQNVIANKIRQFQNFLRI